MRFRWICCWLLFLSFSCFAWAGENHVLSFNGVDQQVDISMEPLVEEWTVSARIFKEGEWGVDEVIVGSGWITVSEWEDYPLLVHKGKLCCFRMGLFASEAMPKGWHQVTASYDGEKTRLFIDGKQVAEEVGGRPICPAFIGSDDGKEYFKGKMDEVRIWSKGLDAATIAGWMNKEVTSKHPHYANLVAYYRFDDLGRDATDYKGIHRGDIKVYYKSKQGQGPEYVLSDDAGFILSGEPLKVLSAEGLETRFDLRPGQVGAEVLKLKVRVEGGTSEMNLSGLALDLGECDDLADIRRVKVVALGPNAALSSPSAQLLGSYEPKSKMSLELSHPIRSGVQYFSVVVDLAPNAKAGNAVGIKASRIDFGESSLAVKTSETQPPRRILPKDRDPERLKVLNWNIWHGGIEKGRERGPQQVIEIIQASDADIVTMVETYGSGPKISKALGFHYYEPSAGSNLSIMSRYPIVKTFKSAKGDFYSIGAQVKLPSGREMMVWGIWIRYWGPDYMLQQYSKKYTAKDWIEGDVKTSYADLKTILEQDIAKHYDGEMPIIFAGDFNSCSHLDFTEAAADAGLHRGWLVDFPTHKLMLEAGFKDSFREVNPDEVKDHGGTWAAIYRWSNDFRIDFIYYKGKGIQALRSRVIDEPVQADVIWPGDHSAVLSEFKVSPPLVSE